MIKKIISILAASLVLQGAAFEIEASSNVALHNNRGVVFLQDKNYIAAISEFKIAIALAPDSPASATFYNNLGLTYNKVKKHDWAQTSFENAIQLNSNFFEYYENLVHTYKLKNTLDKNLAKYKNMLAKDNLNSRAWLFSGLIYKEKGDYKKSVSNLKTYILLEPELILTDAVKKYVFEINQEYKL